MQMTNISARLETPASKLPLGEWLDRWLDEYAPATSRPSTLDGYRTYVEH